MSDCCYMKKRMSGKGILVVVLHFPENLLPPWWICSGTFSYIELLVKGISQSEGLGMSNVFSSDTEDISDAVSIDSSNVVSEPNVQSLTVSLASLRELSHRWSTFCASYVIEVLAALNFLLLQFSLKLVLLCWNGVLIRCIFSMMHNNWKSTNGSVKFNFIIIDSKHLTLCTFLTSHFTTQTISSSI